MHTQRTANNAVIIVYIRSPIHRTLMCSTRRTDDRANKKKDNNSKNTATKARHKIHLEEAKKKGSCKSAPLIPCQMGKLSTVLRVTWIVCKWARMCLCVHDGQTITPMIFLFAELNYDVPRVYSIFHFLFRFFVVVMVVVNLVACPQTTPHCTIVCVCTRMDTQIGWTREARPSKGIRFVSMKIYEDDENNETHAAMCDIATTCAAHNCSGHGSIGSVCL